MKMLTEIQVRVPANSRTAERPAVECPKPQALMLHAMRGGAVNSIALALAALAALTTCNDRTSTPPLEVDLRGQTVAVDVDRVLGFETPTADWRVVWGGSGAIGTADSPSQGLHALAVAAKGYVAMQSAPLSSLGDRVGGIFAYDLRLPSAQPNPYWYGTTQMYVNIPSLGVNNVFIGQVELTGRPLGQWFTVGYPASADLVTKLEGSYSDLQFVIVLNVPSNATGTYGVDNLRLSSNSLAIVSVVDGAGRPISGAPVVAYMDSATTNHVAMTDSGGVARLSLPPGHYRFGVTDTGNTYFSGSINHCHVPGICAASTIVDTCDGPSTCPCMQTRRTVGTLQRRPFDLAASGGSLYWTNAADGSIQQGTSSSTASTALVTGRTDPFGIAADDGYVYWTELSPGLVLRVSKSGGTPAVLASGQNRPQFVAVDSSYVYWTSQGTMPGLGTVNGVAKDGSGAIRLVASQQAHPYAIAADGTSIFWTNIGDGTIWQAPAIASRPPWVLAVGQGEPFALALDDTFVYWADYYTGLVSKVGRLGGKATVLANDSPGLWGIAVDATRVYWTNGLTGQVNVVSKTGGQTCALATAVLPRRMTTDGTSIYWTESGPTSFKGSVARLGRF
jgi:hypothetical protein